MVPHDPSLPWIDPRQLVKADGPTALADLFVQTGYVIQRGMLIDLTHCLRSGKPWLIEGPRGGGKTALAEALAKGCNLPCFYLQGMKGLGLEDVLYQWDREGQNQWVRQATTSGLTLAEARAAQWSRQYLVLGEALAAFDMAAREEIVPVFILDEADKLEEHVEDMLLQLFGRGWAHVPRLGDIGVRSRGKWPVVILLSNDIRHDLSAPLRSRCIYSWLEPPTPREEVRILRVRVPQAPPELLGAVVKLINCIRGMGGVIDKPGLRESIDLLESLAGEESQRLTLALLDEHLCYLGKRRTDLANIRKGLARLEQAIQSPHPEIDEWVSWAVSERSSVLEQV
ncbi:MAG TPA: MoxR family ATPase [Blastocatellia bacterium]|nr:MoxR family ATPase [Blastocatellia bacterium]